MGRRAGDSGYCRCDDCGKAPRRGYNRASVERGEKPGRPDMVNFWEHCAERARLDDLDKQTRR